MTGLNTNDIYGPPRKHKGAALLLLLLFIIVGTITVFTAAQKPQNVDEAKGQHDRDILIQAKKAVIAYAALNNNPNDDPAADVRPGEILCPDIDNDGQSTGGPEGCGGIPNVQCCTYRGWLPYETLDIEEPRDSSGARLWYAVSHAYQFINPNPLNTAIPGALQLNGNQVVAVIIAPGQPISGQDPRPGVEALDLEADAVVDRYLDFLNADGDATVPDDATASTYFTKAANNPGANDMVIAITADDVWKQAVGWPLEQARRELSEYHNADNDAVAGPDFRLPYAKDSNGDCTPDAANLTGLLPVDNNAGCDNGDALALPGWFVNNSWDRLIYYIVSGECVSLAGCQGAGGELTYNGVNVDALIAESGAELSAVECGLAANYDQRGNRVNSSAVCEYLDTQQNTDGDLVFSRPDIDDVTNDRLLSLDY